MINMFVTYFQEFRIYESTNLRIHDFFFTKNVFFSFKEEKKIDGIIDVTLFDGVEGLF